MRYHPETRFMAMFGGENSMLDFKRSKKERSLHSINYTDIK